MKRIKLSHSKEVRRLSLGVPLNHFEVDLEQRLVRELMIVVGHAVGQEGDGDLRDGPESGGGDERGHG